MNKLKYICSYIWETVKSHPMLILLMLFTTIISGFVSLNLYCGAKSEAGRLDRAFVPTYMLTAWDRPFAQEDDGLDELIDGQVLTPIAKLLKEKEAITQRVPEKYDEQAGNNKQMSCVLLDKNNQEVHIALSWNDKLWTKSQLESGQRLVRVPQFMLDTDEYDIGQKIELLGYQFEIVGSVDNTNEYILPYNCPLDQTKIKNLDYRFVPNAKLTQEEMATIRPVLEEIKKPTTGMVLAFIGVTIICALNTLISVLYVAKRSRVKYSIAKMLGATNGLIAVSMLLELSLVAIVGNTIGVIIDFALLSNAGILTRLMIDLDALDFLITVVANVVVVAVVSLYSIIKRASNQPCKQ